MSKILGKYKEDYEDIMYLETNNKNDIYVGYNKKDKRDVTLKIINKEKSNNDNLLKEKLNKEIEIINSCKSNIILDIYRLLETDNNFILEQEFYETNMHEYIMDNGPLNLNKNFFKKIAIELAKALKIIYDRKIIHRKIKSSSIFLKENNGKYQIKLGNFEQAILIDDNKSEPLDSFYYTAPEIINGDKYDEKSDLWSFGITLYDMYFGDLPYGYKPSKMKIIKAISSKDNFHYEKSNIPILDYIFDGLLKLDPEDRMPYEELFDILLKKDFMNKDEIYKKKDSINEILRASLRRSKEISYIVKEEKYNNILYYDENKKGQKFRLKDCNSFEEETPGTFIFCSCEDSFKLIKEEIKREYNKNNKIKFNLITTGSTFEKINRKISEDIEFKNCFENKCIYCSDLLKYDNFKYKYQDTLHNNIYNKKKYIIDFIHRTSNDKISPFKINELIFYAKNSPKYDAIYQFYGKSDKEKDQKYFKDFEKFINKKNQNELKDKAILLKEFNNIANHNFLKKFINNLYKDLNKYIIEEKNIEECIAYFTARILHYLVEYGNKNNKYYNWEKNELYLGTNLKLSELLPYERKKGLVIQFPSFNMFYENKELAEELANRKQSEQYYNENLKFSVIFILKNRGLNMFGINVEEFYNNKEKAIILLPFAPLEITDIVFDFRNFKADIYLISI